jgi:hypothetical protein
LVHYATLLATLLQTHVIKVWHVIVKPRHIFDAIEFLEVFFRLLFFSFLANSCTLPGPDCLGGRFRRLNRLITLRLLQ